MSRVSLSLTFSCSSLNLVFWTYSSIDSTGHFCVVIFADTTPMIADAAFVFFGDDGVLFSTVS